MPRLSRKFLNAITNLRSILHVSTARPTLTTLPNELILLIAEYLSSKDLSSLIKTNRHLAILLAPLFHKHALDWARRLKSSFPISLNIASRQGDEIGVGLLLEIGVNVDTADHNGETALHIAASCGHIGVAKLLLKQGADVNSRNSSGLTPIDVAVRQVKTPVVKLLLENGASILIDSMEREMHPVLRWAAEFGTVELVELLLGSLDDVEIAAQDSKEKTALHYAVERTQKPARVAQLLLERGVDIDARDGTERTALYYALTELLREYSWEKRITAHRRQREAIVILLIEKKAELDIETINLLVHCEKKVGRFSKIRCVLSHALDTLN